MNSRYKGITKPSLSSNSAFLQWAFTSIRISVFKIAAIKSTYGCYKYQLLLIEEYSQGRMPRQTTQPGLEYFLHASLISNNSTQAPIPLHTWQTFKQTQIRQLFMVNKVGCYLLCDVMLITWIIRLLLFKPVYQINKSRPFYHEISSWPLQHRPLPGQGWPS